MHNWLKIQLNILPVKNLKTSVFKFFEFFLYLIFTELVKDESFRSCLLWAGCMGGDLNIVKMWFSPGMDINHPKEFVTSFDDCENNTPLYAACSGKLIYIHICL